MATESRARAASASPAAGEARLAELVGSLSLATELAMGLSDEHELRGCLTALELGRRLGLDDEQLAETYYVALLRWVGCTSHAHELARWFDDEIEAHARTAFRWPSTGILRRRLTRSPAATRAKRLFVTPRTVSSHVEHIYAKLGVSSRARATHFATQHGLVGSFEAGS